MKWGIEVSSMLQDKNNQTYRQLLSMMRVAVKIEKAQSEIVWINFGNYVNEVYTVAVKIEKAQSEIVRINFGNYVNEVYMFGSWIMMSWYMDELSVIHLHFLFLIILLDMFPQHLFELRIILYIYADCGLQKVIQL